MHRAARRRSASKRSLPGPAATFSLSLDSLSNRVVRRGSKRIPSDLLFDILSRLPARSVIRFRCVCKLWQSITHEPHFIDAHLQRAPNSILIFLDYHRGRYGRRSYYHRIKVLHSRGPVLTRPTPNNSHARLKSSCNGLLCIESPAGVELFNPATRESLMLPDNTRVFNVMLGFHPVTKEYKVVRFVPKGTTTLVAACEVYTLGTPSWREICHLDYSPLWENGAAVKGAIYWRVYNVEGYKEVVPDIVSFDLKDENFTPFSLPNFDIVYGKHKYTAGDLVELQGSVCISVSPDFYSDSDSRDQQLDIWMLDDEHGIEHRWTRKYSITTPKLMQPARPLLIHKEKILLRETCAYKDCWMSDTELGSPYQCHIGMLRYHYLKRRRRREVYWQDRYYFEPFVHVESLVPLRKEGVH